MSVTIGCSLQKSIFLLIQNLSHPVNISNNIKLSINFPGYNIDNFRIHAYPVSCVFFV